MNPEEEQKMQQLIQMGLSPKTARCIARLLLPELGDMENAGKNAALLSRYMDISALDTHDATRLVLFLREPYEKTQAIPHIPEKLGFSEDQKRRFEEMLSESIMNWGILELH